MVRVSVEPSHVEIELGSSVTIEVRVFNASEIVDHFVVSAVGVDPSWVSVDVARSQLEPGGEGTVRMSIAVPDSAQLPAGEHVFGIRVASLSDPAQSVVEEVHLDIGEETGVSLQLEPSQLRAGRWGRTNVSVDNQGNRAVDVAMRGTDPEMVMAFTFAPTRLELPAFTSKIAVLRVGVPRRWTGRPLTRSFTVEGTYDGGTAAASGTFVQSAVFAPWLVKAVSAITALAVVAIIAIALTNGRGGDPAAVDGVSTSEPAAVTSTTEDIEEQPPVDDPTSAAPVIVPVAELVGLTVLEAQAWANGQGIDLVVSPDFVDVGTDTGLAGRVATQTVPAGTEVASGASIGVAIGVVRIVQTPDLFALAEDQAMQALTDVGLVGRVDGTVEVNMLSGLESLVVEQSPVAGADVEQGATVSMFVGVNAPIVVDWSESLLASYPLSSDGQDLTGNNSEATLVNTVFAEGGVYCHGVLTNMDPAGCDVLTPSLVDFSFDRFSVHVQFQAESFQDGPVIVGGKGYRWIGFLLTDDGTTTLLYNNQERVQCNSFIRYEPGRWHGAVLTYDGRTAELYLDGALACQVEFDIVHGGDATFGTGNYSNGTVFQGWVRDLNVYSEIVPPAAG